MEYAITITILRVLKFVDCSIADNGIAFTDRLNDAFVTLASAPMSDVACYYRTKRPDN